MPGLLHLCGRLLLFGSDGFLTMEWMNLLTRRSAITIGFALAAFVAAAQGPRVEDALPGVDLHGLSPAQKVTVQKLLAERECTCGCGMKVAECRVKDPGCSMSRGVAAVIVEAIRNGKSESEAIAAADKSNFGRAADTRILGDAVSIPTQGSPSAGAANAKVTLVEFSDFQCPYCIVAAGELHRVMEAYPSQVSLIFKQFPLDEHSQAALAAAASLSAQKQGKFWPMHDALFAQRGRLSPETIHGIAEKLGLDMKRFDADLHSPELQKTIVRDIEDGERAGVMGTPTIFVNGQRYNAAVSLAVLKPVLDEELKKTAK